MKVGRGMYLPTHQPPCTTPVDRPYLTHSNSLLHPQFRSLHDLTTSDRDHQPPDPIPQLQILISPYRFLPNPAPPYPARPHTQPPLTNPTLPTQTPSPTPTLVSYTISQPQTAISNPQIQSTNSILSRDRDLKLLDIPRPTETYRPSDTQPPNPTLITETPSSIPIFVHNPISLPHIAISNPQIQSPNPRSRYSPTPSTSLLLTTILLRLTPPTLPVPLSSHDDIHESHCPYVLSWQQ